MSDGDTLPASFLTQIRALEASYLASDDPIEQSGFGGGARRWRAERSPILEAIEGDGTLLDLGCANGYLLACLVRWGHERGRTLVPYGVDIGPRLIAAARRRLPQYADHFYVANVWDWMPPRRFRYVYTLHDCVPPTHLERYLRRLLARAVESGGRLIVGAYGSRSRGTPPVPIAHLVASYGLTVAGAAAGGDLPITSFVWVTRD